MTERREREPGREWVTANNAAKQLAVGVELVNGMVSNGAIAGWSAPGKSGGEAWFVYVDQIAPLQARMAAQR